MSIESLPERRNRALMSCCARCSQVDRWSYELSGDGNGVEFLAEIGHLIDGGRLTSTVVFRAPGLQESIS